VATTTGATEGDVAGGARAARLDRLSTLPTARKSRLWSRWVPAALVAVVAGFIGWAFISAPAMNWPVVAKYLFSAPILQGVATTLGLTIFTFAFGLLLGIVLALMRQSRNPVLVAVYAGYVWIFRGTPLLVQLVFWFNLALIFPYLGVRIPLWGIDWGGDTNTLITPYLSALIGLTLHTAAYMAEVVRGGFLAVPRGQVDAALAIGMSGLQAQRLIVIPQAIRVILPPLGNQFIDILKGTSIVSVIGGGDLMTRAQQIYGQNYQVIALLVVASLWYLVLVTVATIGQHYLEKAMDADRRPRRGPATAATGGGDV